MKCWSGRLLATVLVFFLVGGAAQADLITPWTYSWSRSPLSVAADASSTGGGSINLTLVNPAAGTHMTGDNPITAVDLATNNSQTVGSTSSFTNSPYALTLHLSDSTSGASTDFTFNGQFNGTVTPTNASISTTFLDPSTQNAVLGQHQYTVVLDSYIPPGGPTATTFGSIGAHVTIQDAGSSGGDNNGGGGSGGSGGVQDVPEPSTLVLAGMTLPAAGLAWLRTRSLRLRRPAGC
jgi:hypothetical protein